MLHELTGLPFAGGAYFPGFVLHELIFPTVTSPGELWLLSFFSYSPSSQPVIVPRQIGGLDRIPLIEAAAGRSHLLVLDAMGGVWSSGQGGCGQLGHGDEEFIAKPRLIAKLRADVDAVVQVAAGGDSSMVVTEAAEVLSFGNGAAGQLGHGSLANELTPKRIESIRSIAVRRVCVGGFHSAAVTNGGSVFWWGTHHSCPAGGATGLPYVCGENPLPVTVQVPGGETICTISAGSTHTLLVAKSGKLFALGSGSSGQLGCDPPRRTFKSCSEATFVSALGGVKVKHAECGILHSVVLTERGEVYTFGDGTRGALGHGRAEDELMPRRIEAFGSGVTNIVAGGLHTVVEREGGNLCGFGSFTPGFRTFEPVQF